MSDKLHHKASFHCPVCGGYDTLPQGKGVRCAGFTSTDKNWTNCSRDEYAGSIPLDVRTQPPTYPHKMIGDCKCGTQHGEKKAPVPLKRVTRYEVVGTNAVHIREDLGDKKRIWWEPKGVEPKSLPLWRTWDLKEDTVIITEGEKACDALITQGFPAVGTYGASVIPELSLLTFLKDRTVYLWPDNDQDGERWLSSLSDALAAVGVQPNVIRWIDAPAKGDAWDYFSLGNHDVPGLLAAAKPPSTGEMTFHRDDDMLIAKYTVPSGVELTFIASNVRNERTGVHANVAVYVAGDRLSYNNFNVERASERTTLTNTSHDALGDLLQVAVPKKALRTHLDQFCGQLWDEFNAAVEIEMLGGTEEPEPLAWIHEPYVVEEAGTILYALPGQGKTFTAMGMAVAIHHGLMKNPWGTVHQKCPVLYVNLERGRKGIQRRIGGVNAALGLPRATQLPFISGRGRSLIDVLGRVSKAVREGTRVVFLDSISRSGMGSMNADDVANKIMDSLNSLGVAWFAIAHMAKEHKKEGTSRSIYGAVHFEAAADLTIDMISDDSDPLHLGVTLTGDKANDMPKPPPIYLRYDFDPEFGIIGIHRTTADALPMLAARVMSAAERIEDYLRSDGPADAATIATELTIPPSSVRRHLTKNKRFVFVRKEGKNALYGVSARPSTSPEHMSRKEVLTQALPKERAHEHMSTSDSNAMCSGCGEEVDANYGDDTVLCRACWYSGLPDDMKGHLSA